MAWCRLPSARSRGQHSAAAVGDQRGPDPPPRDLQRVQVGGPWPAAGGSWQAAFDHLHVCLLPMPATAAGGDQPAMSCLLLHAAQHGPRAVAPPFGPQRSPMGAVAVGSLCGAPPGSWSWDGGSCGLRACAHPGARRQAHVAGSGAGLRRSVWLAHPPRLHLTLQPTSPPHPTTPTPTHPPPPNPPPSRTAAWAARCRSCAVCGPPSSGLPQTCWWPTRCVWKGKGGKGKERLKGSKKPLGL